MQLGAVAQRWLVLACAAMLRYATLVLVVVGCSSADADGKHAPVAPPDDDSCGGSTADDDDFPLDCVTDDDVDSPTAQKSVGRSRPGKDLPTLVDHRADGLEGPVYSQGKVGMCTAAAIATTVDHALLRRAGAAAKPPPVSPMHIWSRYHVGALRKGLEANRDLGIAAASTWPLELREACSWARTQDCAKKRTCHMPDVACGVAPDGKRARAADRKPVTRITEVTKLGTTDPGAWKRALAAGQDLLIVLHVDKRKFKRSALQHAAFGSLIADYDESRKKSGHAVALAGYRTERDATYYLIHNSWGTQWGDDGYAWIAERTLLANIKVAYLVDAELEARAAAAKPKRMIVHCRDGRFPDVATQKCDAACPDGGPRVGGACPAVGPTPVTGADASVGAAWVCGRGGCAYTIELGNPGCAKSSTAVCQRSCPADKPILSYGPDGVGCSE